MSLTAKDFLNEKEIVFIGFSGNEKSFSRGVYADFVASGMKVYPVNLRSFTEGDIKVYGSVGEIANPPDKAYVLINKENAKKFVASLPGTPVRKLWFQEADAEILELMPQGRNRDVRRLPADVSLEGFHASRSRILRRRETMKKFPLVRRKLSNERVMAYLFAVLLLYQFPSWIKAPGLFLRFVLVLFAALAVDTVSILSGTRNRCARFPPR